MNPKAPPNWYPDPSGKNQLRWWDGNQWTSHVAPHPQKIEPPRVPLAKEASYTASLPKFLQMALWFMVFFISSSIANYMLGVFGFGSNDLTRMGLQERDYSPIPPFLIFLLSLGAAWFLAYKKNSRAKTSARPPRPTYGSAPAASKPRVVASKYDSYPKIAKATTPGNRSTPYLTSKMESVTLPALNEIHGNPGAGLHTAGFGQAGVRGAAGELAFAKMLYKAGLHEHAHTFWSMRIPDVKAGRVSAPSRYSTDVDCLIVSGKKIFLVDVKNYASGGLRWESEGDTLYAIDEATQAIVGNPHKASKNMSMAQEAYEYYFKNYDIEVHTVLVASGYGEGKTDNWGIGVYWNGGRTRTASSFIEHILKETSANTNALNFSTREDLKFLLK